MNDMNKVLIIGRLTRDAELKYTNNGKAVSSFSVANNRSYSNGEQRVDQCSFFEVSLWGKSAEALKPYLTKGKQVCLSGRIEQQNWNDSETGARRSKIIITADDVQLLGGNAQGGQAQGNGYQNQPQANNVSFVPQNGSYAQQNGTMPNQDEEFPNGLPF